jgi:transcription initiation factor TFIID subunit 12
MNNGAQGQPAQGQPGQSASPVTLFKPEQMRNLPNSFTAAEKVKWEHGLTQLWAGMEKNPPETPAHQEAKRKLFEFSRTLMQKLQALRTTTAPANGQNQPRPQIPKKILDHVNQFPFVIPSTFPSGTAEATKWLQDAKNRYMKGLMAMDSASTQLASLEALLKKRTEEGKPFNPQEEKEYEEKKSTAMKRHGEAKHFVDNFRTQQHRAVAERQANQQANGNGNGNGGNSQARPQMSVSQPSSAGQSTQTINAAIEAARNQQIGGGMQQNGQPSMPNQNAPSQSSIPQHQGGQVQNIKQEAGVPHNINTQLQGRPMQNNTNSPRSGVPPQSAGPQSAVSQTNPVALTHPQALQQVSRTYSSGQASGTPNVMGHTHSGSSRETPNVTTTKMPIPKNRPPGATAPPQPVAMSQARPTYTSGANGSGNGVVSQPVLQKAPGYNMDGDADRILNKKKLYELVTQVTGGGDVLGGEVLTPEVEEVRNPCIRSLPTSLSDTTGFKKLLTHN